LPSAACGQFEKLLNFLADASALFLGQLIANLRINAGRNLHSVRSNFAFNYQNRSIYLALWAVSSQIN
jgi:hypothetical protein